MDYEQIAREIIEEAKAIDAAEDELYGEKRGDELPEQLTTAAGRRKWLSEAKRRLDEAASQGGSTDPGSAAEAPQRGQAAAAGGVVHRAARQRGL